MGMGLYEGCIPKGVLHVCYYVYDTCTHVLNIIMLHVFAAIFNECTCVYIWAPIACML